MQLLHRSRLASVLVVALSTFSLARADLGDGPLFQLDAVNNRGDTTSYQVDASRGHWDQDHLTWHLTNALMLRDPDSGELLGTLNQAQIDVYQDPAVILNFAVQAGPAATQFVITSALLTFPTINPSLATASASITTADAANFDGTLLSGDGASGGAYTAFYNGNAPAVGTVYAEFINSISSPPVFPPGAGSGTAGPTVLGAISSMSSQFQFTLSAGDQANGTSTFVVTPEPATAGLLALSLLLVRRR